MDKIPYGLGELIYKTVIPTLTAAEGACSAAFRILNYILDKAKKWFGKGSNLPDGDASDGCVAGGASGVGASFFDRIIKSLEGMWNALQYCQRELEKVLADIAADASHTKVCENITRCFYAIYYNSG